VAVLVDKSTQDGGTFDALNLRHSGCRELWVAAGVH
jgi:hypothetical protein